MQNEVLVTEADSPITRESTFKFNASAAEKALAVDEAFNTLEWTKLGLHPGLSKYLVKFGYTKPTYIEELCIKQTIRECTSQILTAQTGSGKTLAYFLPMIEDIISDKSESARKIKYMIVTPTRELAIQIFEILTDIFNLLNKIYAFSVVLTGGLSKDKQYRILQLEPPIIIGTPGRIYDLMEEHEYFKDLTHLKRIVIDEADKMLEQGGFADLVKLVQYVNNQAHEDAGAQPPSQKDEKNDAEVHEEEDKSSKSVHESVQISLISATMNLPELFREKGMKFEKNEVPDKTLRVVNYDKSENEIEYLNILSNLKFRNLQIQFIDKSPDHLINEAIIEKWIHVNTYQEKLEYLLYIILNFKVPTICFTNSITESKKLAYSCRLLGINAVCIYAQMPERQRLKNLDRLRNGDSTILFTTDVCARGIDIPQVKLVIELAKPASPATHVHRIGRCVRNEGNLQASTEAGGSLLNNGLAISLIEKEDSPIYNEILTACNYTKKQSPEPLKIELEVLESCELTMPFILQSADKELEHQVFGRKTSVFKEAEEALEGELMGDLLDATGLKKYHEKAGKKLGDQRANLAAVEQDIERTCSGLRLELIAALKRSLLLHLKVFDADGLITSPREIQLPSEYKFEQNLVNSEAVNDGRKFFKEKGEEADKIDVKVVDAKEPQKKAEKEPKARAAEQSGTNSHKKPRKPKSAVEKDSQRLAAQVVSGKVVELAGEAELPERQSKRERVAKPKVNKKQYAKEGRAIVTELGKAGLGKEDDE